jgi:hypothetical protein
MRGFIGTKPKCAATACARRLGPIAALLLGVTMQLCSPAGATAACPNESLRSELGSSQLPDCRAYEMVTPAFKEDYGFFVSSYSPDGGEAVLTSLGAVSGAAGGSEAPLTGTAYLAQRTAGGWHATPISPSLNEFVGQLLQSSEASEGDSLWVQHTPQQSAKTQELYVRSASGAYSRIGPLLPPALTAGEPSNAMESFLATAPVAATPNYSHLILSNASAGARWPFDHTEGSGTSLYEYTGSGNSEPTLVGVTGAKGSDELVSDCGSALGSSAAEGGGSAYNALSLDGETVFFTPELTGVNGCVASEPTVAEVYARLHGAPSSPLAAETVDVSARSTTDCSGACSTSVPSGKHFEGASQSGEKVFFTGTQRLMNQASEDPEPADDAAGAGGCASTTGAGGCNLYEYDFGSEPADRTLKLIAGGAEVLGVARISEDGSRVYFVAKGVLTSAPNRFGATAQAGAPNLYVYDTATEPSAPTFIATLALGDSRDWAKDDERPVQASSGEGRYVLFASEQTGLTPGDTATTEQLFEYDAVTGELVRVTQGEDGYNDNGNSVGEGVSAERIAEGTLFARHDYKAAYNAFANLSADGSTVAFQTSGRLSEQATSAEQKCTKASANTSVYEFRSDGAIEAGALYLISDGRDVESNKGSSCGAEYFAVSADGSNILFSTADPLIKADVDGGQRDIYDARIEGGFPLPGEAAQCVLTGCLATIASPPNIEIAQSASQAAGENLPPPAPAKAPVPPRVTVGKHSLRGTRLSISLAVSEAGTITVSGAAIKSVSGKATKAATYKLTTALSSGTVKALKKRHKLKLTLTVKVVGRQGGITKKTFSVTVGS